MTVDSKFYWYTFNYQSLAAFDVVTNEWSLAYSLHMTVMNVYWEIGPQFSQKKKKEKKKEKGRWIA